MLVIPKLGKESEVSLRSCLVTTQVQVQPGLQKLSQTKSQAQVKKQKMPGRHGCVCTCMHMCVCTACALPMHMCMHARPQVNGYLICIVRIFVCLKKTEILWECFSFNPRCGAASVDHSSYDLPHALARV